MLDTLVRRHIDPPFERLCNSVFKTFDVSPLQLTLFGFLSGILSFAFLSQQKYKIAIALILLNRFCDLLDGIIARMKDEQSDLGAFYDISFDFIIYAGVVFSFALGRGDLLSLQIGIYVLFAIFTTGTAFLAFAIFAAKNKIETTTQKLGHKSLHFLGGLIEGTETFIFIIAICMFPTYWIHLWQSLSHHSLDAPHHSL